jgi:HEAT repeat protein
VDIMSGAATPYPLTSAGLHGPEPVRRRLLEILDAPRRTPRHQQAALFLLLIFIPAWTLAPATSSGPQIPSATAETPTFDGNGIPSDRILRALRGLANDPEPGVRRSVVNALRDIGGEDATAMLRVMLSDRDEDVVRATREALGLVTTRPNLVFDVRPTSRVTAHVLDSLVLLLGSAEPRRRLEAARVLGNLKDERSTPALVLALGDSEFSVRQAAADALGGIRDYEPVPHLVLRLADSHRRVRQSAAGALAAIPSRAAVPALIIALRDVDEHVRMSAASALGRAGGTDAMEALISALGDEEAGVRRVAVGALAEVATRRSQ